MLRLQMLTQRLPRVIHEMTRAGLIVTALTLSRPAPYPNENLPVRQHPILSALQSSQATLVTVVLAVLTLITAQLIKLRRLQVMKRTTVDVVQVCFLCMWSHTCQQHRDHALMLKMANHSPHDSTMLLLNVASAAVACKRHCCLLKLTNAASVRSSHAQWSQNAIPIYVCMCASNIFLPWSPGPSASLSLSRLFLCSLCSYCCNAHTTVTILHSDAQLRREP